MESYQQSRYSAELAQAVGFVIVEAAAAEDTIAEVVVLRQGTVDSERHWWRSGEALAAALESIGDSTLDPITQELRRLYPERNYVVHGLWLEWPEGPISNMVRNKSTSRQPVPTSYTERTFMTLKRLSELANDFRKLEEAASSAVSRAMGLTERD
ncbi:MAG: hypothetical protein HLX51_08210 [Micrococcaceae bacterium]|nr:hypothetical protein [Micrococcaceae bacterium]